MKSSNKMTTTSCRLLLIFALVQISCQRSTSDSDSYVAAVVEFPPQDPSPSGEAPTSVNAVGYVSFIEKAAEQNADIIVFPEAGLTSINWPDRELLNTWATLIPPASSNYNPCIDSAIPVSQALIAISCAAKENSLYVVINIVEKVICSKETCSTDNRLLYNTNVVFDREGKIIARYRKSNLYQEPFDVTKIPEVVTFDTDFGVTFGTFICADILYKKPALYLTRLKNVTDVVFSTAWFSELPFMTALQPQTGWAYAEDVNFLVSGYNRPNHGNAGSAIYLGRQGIANVTMPMTVTGELVVANVPKKNRGPQMHPAYSYGELESDAASIEWMRNENQEEHMPTAETKDEKEGFPLLKDDLSAYKSVQFNSSIAQTLCDGDFCCDFDVVVTKVDPSSNYHLVVYNGDTVYDELVIVGLYVCAVVLCSNHSVASCAVFEKSQTTFNTIAINMTFPNYEDLLIMPNSLGENLYPLSNWTYEERYEEKKVHISATLGRPTKNLVTCGIYTRDFTRDRVAKEHHSDSGVSCSTLTALGIVSVFLLFFYRK